MQEFPTDDIRRLFRDGRDFNELFEAFRKALENNICEVDAYRELFWNSSLEPDELLFFAKKLESAFPNLAYDVYMWLSKVMEARVPNADSIELSFLCLKKACEFNTKSLEPYLSACKLYDHDLKTPDIQGIISFLKEGSSTVNDSQPLFEQLSILYSIAGNDEMAAYYERKAHPSS